MLRRTGKDESSYMEEDGEGEGLLGGVVVDDGGGWRGRNKGW